MKRINKVLSYVLVIALILTQSMSTFQYVSFADETTKAIEKKTNPVPLKQDKKSDNYEARAKTEIIVKYKDETKKEIGNAKIKSKLKMKELKTNRVLTNKKISILEVAENSDIQAVISELKKDPNVVYAQPNYPLELMSTPSDESYVNQWGLTNIGQEIVGKNPRSGVDVNIENAWNLTKGSEDVVVGVLDTGIDITHSDLENNIYRNPYEIDGNGIDDDGNGYIDDINGWDFAGDDASVYDSEELDLHGTYVSGIIAASENETGIIGVAPNVKVLPLKFINGSTGYTCDAIEAIEYAMNMGVKVINCSFGGTDNNLALKDAMQNSGILFVTAAGNRGGDVSTLPVYPAAFDLTNIISVTAIDTMGVLPNFSSYGASVDIAAPGTNILSTAPNNSYDYYNGTSASAPFVTGAVALLLSTQPSSSISTLKAQILNNARPCAALETRILTGGRLDVFGALSGTVGELDDYNGPNAGDDTLLVSGEGEGDTWYTQDQLLRLKERLHYGEGGVNPASGNYSFTATDMSIASPGFQVNFSRTYNSREENISMLGRGWTFGFEGSLTGIGTKTIDVKLPSGSSHRFNFDGGVYNPEDTRAKFHKNANGTYVLTTQDQYTYTFSAAGWLVAMTDENGNTLSITVDAAGKVQSVTDTVGRIYTIQYNGVGLIDNIKDPENRIVRYEYDANKRLIKAVDPTGGLMHYEYDASGYLTVIKDHFLKPIQSLTYNHSAGDAQHKVSTSLDSNGAAWTYSYNMIDRKTTITDANQRKWTYFFDASMYTVKTQDPEGNVEITEYYAPNGKNVFGDVTKRVDKYGNTTLYSLDASGNVTKITYPDMSTESFSYDSKNHVIKKTNASGIETHYVYDSNHINKEKEIVVRKNVTYSEIGMPVSDYNGTYTVYYTKAMAQTQFGCNVAGLVKSVKEPNGAMVTYTYDAHGNTKTKTDSVGNVTTYEYNAIGWMTAEISPASHRTEYSYDLNGQLIRVKNPDGGIQRTVYDKLGRKVQEISPNQYVASSDVAVDTYAEAVGTRYAYNDKGNLDTVTTLDDGVTKYTYDIYGNILTETLPNGAIHTYSYDVMDRLIKTTFKENATASEIQLYAYSYGKLDNGKSQRTEIKYLNDSETATTVSVYDFAGRLVEVQYPNGSKSKTEYNGDGTVAKETATNGAITSYVYDDFGRLSGVYKPMSVENGGTKYSYTAFAYDKNGNKTEEKKGNELVLLGSLPTTWVNQYYEYNSDDTLKRTYDQDGSETRYTYDQEGNLKSQTIKLNDSEEQVQQFVYGFGGRKLEETLIASADDFYGVVTDGVLKTTFTYDKNDNLLTMTTPNGVTTTYTYDVMNRMLTQNQPGFDEHGAPVTLTESKTYDISGNVLTTTDAKGNLTTYVYDAQNRCIKTIDALGGTTLSTYDRAGRKTAEVLPNSYDPEKSLDQMARTEYLYGNMDQVIAVTLKYEKLTYDDISGVWLRTWTETVTKAFKYDNSLRVIKELSGEGYAAGAGLTVQDKITNGYGTETTYNLAGLPLTIRDAATKVAGLVATLNYTYDAQGRKVTETNAKNHITQYVYDDSGNLIETRLNGQKQKEQVFDLAGRMIKSIDGNGNETIYEYNFVGKIKRVVYPSDPTIAQNEVSYQYDLSLNVTREENSVVKTTLTTFDTQDRPLTVTVKDREGNTIQSKSNRYDASGNLRFETDPNGNTTETTYDADKRPLTKSVVVGGSLKTTNYLYDANGNQIETTNWLGNKNVQIYDDLNRLVGKTDAYGIMIQTYEYDLNNSQIKSVDVLGNVQSYKYDVNGRRIETQDAEGNVTKVDYDVLGNVIGETDGLGNKTRYEYDAASRLTAVVNALGEKTIYTYDTQGNVLTQTDGNGKTTAFAYNVMNQMHMKTDPIMSGDIARSEKYVYNADGTLRTKTDRNGKTTVYTYDVACRLLNQTIESESISYTYDGGGNTLSMTDQTGVTTWTYDALGRVLTKSVPFFGLSTYAYDLTEGITGLEIGGFAELSTDPKGNITTKNFDKVERLVSVNDGIGTTQFTYYENGTRKSVVYPDGSNETYVYNKNNLNTALINRKADGTLIDTYSYTYDAANKQASKTDAKGTTTFAYDKLGRVSTITEPSGIVTAYTYDKAGNRLSENKYIGEILSQETKYVYDATDRLLSTETKASVLQTTDRVVFTYDANGNMLSKKTTSIKPAEIGNQATFVLEKSGASPNTLTQYYYNAFNQLHASDDGMHRIQYVYNGSGNRVEKTVITGPQASPVTHTTRYHYEKDKVVLEVDESGSEIAKNTYGTNLLSREMAGSTVYYMYNGHADVTALLSANGDIVATYYYDIWGNIAEKMETETVSNPFRYAGYQYDEETDLYYLNARYYDAKIARFLTEDTYTGERNDPLSLNQYTYCHNDPISYDDPTGQWIHIAIGAFIGGAISASIDAVSQVVIEKKSLKEVNWTSVKISAGEGAIAGAIGAATGGASLVASASKSLVKTAIKNVVIDAGVSFGSSVASQAVVKGKVNLSQAVSSAAMSAVSFVGGTAAKKVTAVLKDTNAVKAVSSVAGKVVNAGKTFVKENTNSVKLPAGKTVAPAKPTEAVKPKVTVTGKTNAQVSVGNKVGINIKTLLPGEGNVGIYKDLVKSGSRGDNLTPHHMPSAEYMKKNYDVSKNNGVSMNMEQPSPGVGGRHRSTRSYGSGSDLTESPRDTLARDIMDARRIYQNDGLYTPEIRRSLKEVIDMNKNLYPRIFNKGMR